MLPDRKPDTLSPSLVKQDIPQLKKDIPKHREAGVMIGEKLSQWETLLEDLNKSSTPSEDESDWIFDWYTPVSEGLSSS